MDLYNGLVSGFVLDFGLMPVVIAPHLPEDEDEKSLLLHKLGMIYAMMLEIQRKDGGD